jgi:hypothetical protein
MLEHIGPLLQSSCDVVVMAEGVNKLLKRPKATAILLECVKGKTPFMSVSKNTGRLFTAFCSLPEIYRRRILLNGLPTTALDVKNCQPFLCLAFYDDQSAERQRFRDLVCGTGFYEHFMNKLAIPNTPQNRTEFKVKVFEQILFGKCTNPVLANMRLWIAFEEEFPELAAFILNHRRKHDGLKKKPHSAFTKEEEAFKFALPTILQRMESEIVLEGLCGELAREQEPRIPVITVHDEVIVPCEHAADVKARLERIFLERFGASPRICEKPGSNTIPTLRKAVASDYRNEINFKDPSVRVKGGVQ